MDWRGFGLFVFGFLACAGLFFVFEFFSITGFVVSDYSLSAPIDHIVEEDIVLLDEGVLIRIGGATISDYEDTGSMVPVLDEGSNGIRVAPENESEVEVGDIVSYRDGDRLVVHRVVLKGEDSEGVLFETKGDSNLVSDRRIRFEDIEYVTIGVIY